MLRVHIGLTELYNRIHDPSVEAEDIQELRRIHREIDLAVRDAYGWSDLELDHGFHEMEFLPENDRVRYTVSNEARKEILRRLLELNHQRHQEELEAGLVDENGKPVKKKAGGRKAKAKDEGQGELF